MASARRVAAYTRLERSGDLPERKEEGSSWRIHTTHRVSPKEPTRPLHYLLARKSPKPRALLQPSQPLWKNNQRPPPSPHHRHDSHSPRNYTTPSQPSSTSTTTQPGKVPWTDFVSAMSTISFLPEKLYGSVWRFTPKDGSTFGTETPINFHEPHPSTKLPFPTARMYRRRLTRHYGVDGGCFVLGG
jgi:hypothetical protein